MELAEIKFLSKGYSSPIPTTIYGNMVVILVWKMPLTEIKVLEGITPTAVDVMGKRVQRN